MYWEQNIPYLNNPELPGVQVDHGENPLQSPDQRKKKEAIVNSRLWKTNKIPGKIRDIAIGFVACYSQTVSKDHRLEHLKDFSL